MRQPSAQPPRGSVQLFTYPRRQKKHSPQNVSQLTATRSPGFMFRTALPTLSTMPTPSCPTVTPTFARGTAPRRICTSLVQGEASVMRMTASFSERREGFCFCVSENLPGAVWVKASIAVLLAFRDFPESDGADCRSPAERSVSVLYRGRGVPVNSGAAPIAIFRGARNGKPFRFVGKNAIYT